MTKPDDPAFPQFYFDNRPPGLNKREWFAGMAMQGLCIHREEHLEGSAKLPAGLIARMAVAHADALIAELSKEMKE